MLDDTESACNILYLNATSRHGRWHFSHLLYFAFLSLVPLAQFGLTWVHIEHIIFQHYGVCYIICRICIFDRQMKCAIIISEFLWRVENYTQYAVKEHSVMKV